jgi:hypothetical protein
LLLGVLGDRARGTTAPESFRAATGPYRAREREDATPAAFDARGLGILLALLVLAELGVVCGGSPGEIGFGLAIGVGALLPLVGEIGLLFERRPRAEQRCARSSGWSW